MKYKITALLLIVSFWFQPLPYVMADSSHPLAYSEIADLVMDRHVTLQISRLTLAELKETLNDTKRSNRSAREQLSRLREQMEEVKAIITGQEAAKAEAEAAGLPFDDTALEEAKLLHASLAEAAGAITTADTDLLTKNLELMKIQLEQTQDQLIQAARQLFLQAIGVDSQLNLKKLEQPLLEKAFQAETIKNGYGLSMGSSSEQARIALDTWKSEYAQLEAQKENLLKQLAYYTGLDAAKIILSVQGLEADQAFRSQIQINEDKKSAEDDNYARKQLMIESEYTQNGAEDEIVNLKIKQQCTAIHQDLEAQYQQLETDERKRLLAESELALAKNRFQAAEIQFRAGRISASELEKQNLELRTKEINLQNTDLELFTSIEKYKHLRAGNAALNGI